MDKDQKSILVNVLKRIIFLRWILIIGIAASELISQYATVERTGLTIEQLAVFVVILFLYNSLYWFLIRKGIDAPDKVIEGVRVLQPILDFLAIAVIVYATGGVYGAAFSYFIIPILIADYAYDAVECMLFAILSVFAYLFIAIAEYYGIIPFYAAAGFNYHSFIDVFSAAFYGGFALLFVGIVASLLNAAHGALRNSVLEEKSRVSNIIENISSGVIFTDNKSVILFCNKSAEKIFNILKKDVIGKSMTDVPSNDYVKKMYEIIFGTKDKKSGSSEDVLESSGNITGEEGINSHIFRIESPRYSVIKVTVIPVREQEDSLSPNKLNKKTQEEGASGMIYVIDDITREELMSQMKSEFISVAAHQLRTPLSAVKWTLEMLLSGDLGPISQEQKDFIQKGYETNEHMIGLISDLLDASRIEEGRFGYTFVVSNLEDVIKKAIDEYQQKASLKQISLTYNISGTLPKISIDPDRILLVLTNLIENAVNYTLKGGIVMVKAYVENPYIKTTIQDNGVGIPKTQMSKLFGKFFRGDNAIKMQTEGSGLGLYVVKNIVERHGGQISVESQEGIGTTFTISLPIDSSLIPKEEKPASDESYNDFITGF